jgi:short-subunit dehydrogenase
LASEGIDVLLVSPGTVETEFFDHVIAKRADVPWGDAKGIPAAAVAEQTVRALERGRREIFPNWRGRGMVVANRLFPGIVDRVMMRLASPR